MKMLESKHIMLFIAASLIITGSAFAQPIMQPADMGMQRMHSKEHAEHMPMVPDLTEKQKEQIKQLRTEHLKAMLPLKNQLMEKRARLHTISTSENVNMKEINNMIEEIGAIKTRLMKERAAHRQEIRTLLTQEQRLMFDMHLRQHKSQPHGR